MLLTKKLRISIKEFIIFFSISDFYKAKIPVCRVGEKKAGDFPSAIRYMEYIFYQHIKAAAYIDRHFLKEYNEADSIRTLYRICCALPIQ